VAARCEAALEAVFRALPATRLVASARDLGAFNEVAVARASEAATVRATGGSYARPELSTPYVAPRTDTERKIAEIWQQMLGVAEIGVHDGFLELGGDSLLAARLVSRLREVFEAEVPVRLFFEASTVAALAGEIDALLAQRREAEDQDLTELLGMLEGLSDEEVEAELARRMAGSDALAEVGR
jgi:phthiocerol/phenolphthiocerol synthesis type-I polyketide synthase E